MIDELRLSVLFKGERFSPKKAEEETGISLRDKLEVGDVAKSGPYKGKPMPYGKGVLEVPEEIPYGQRIMWLVDALATCLDKMYELGAEPTQIYAGYFYKDQCNFEFTSQEIQAISKLSIELGISCYDVSEDEK
ncbi:hypothetical protein [Teredinibacter turnerae]|uniref:hypothetical protein n=1 Tax=Teredinibacter turnerae TaxID=2426 RepID=UPI000491D3EB|nr:hypothetical protein [Teredinibacter turnerae]